MRGPFAGALVVTGCALLIAADVQGQTLAAGGNHTVVVTPDGSVWTWGGNGSGQLGTTDYIERRTPEAVPLMSDAIAVAAGSLHTLVLRSDGTVWAFGYNGYGQLGNGTTSGGHSPGPVLGLANVIAIAAGQNHSAALTSDGRIWTWGRNTNGQLGDGTTSGATQPVLQSTLTDLVAIGAGANHTLAVKSDGTVWAWGLNTKGQLGDGTTTQRASPVQMSGVTSATAAAGGGEHSLVLLAGGTLVATGQNTSGQLGDGTNTQRTTAVAVSGSTGVAQIAAAQASSYARRTDGSIWSWGSNVSGRLGDGTTTARNTPTATTLAAGIDIAAGDAHGIAVTAAGVVWAWGDNGFGKLGDGTAQDRPSPIAISDANYVWKAGTPVFSVNAGTYTTEKTVIVTSATPGAVIHYTLSGDTPTEIDPVIASGASVVIDRTTTLKARAWKDAMAPSGIASAVYTLSVATPTFTPSPAPIYTGPQNVTISTSSPGATIRYTTDGSVPNELSTIYSGPLAVGTETTIKAIGFRDNWSSSSIATGSYNFNYGTLSPPAFSPGAGTFTTDAQVTLTAAAGATIRYTTSGANVTSSSPIYVEPLSVTATATVKARAYHSDYTTSAQAAATYTIAVATPELSPTAGTYPAGQIVAITTATPGATLRYTLDGQNPTTSDPVVPAGGIVAGNYTLKVAAWKAGCTTSPIVTASYATTGAAATPQVAGGTSHTLAVREDGVLWAWGYNVHGRLGDGTTTNRLLPVIVAGPTGALAIAAGDMHSLAVGAGGLVWAWGYNGDGQLGDGTTATRILPTAISGFDGAVSASAGEGHSLAVRADGTVWSWGRNSSGQLGDGSTVVRLSPVHVSTLSNITSASANGAHSFALQSDGTLWSWGTNGNGQLGTGNTTSRSTPGPVTGITTATSVAAGGAHGLALLADGTVRSWGSNMSGQLGDGTIVQRTAPVAVSGLTGMVKIAAGGSHSLALAANGDVWAWGSNSNGKLGDGTTQNRWTPVQVQGLPPIAAIAAGSQHSLAIAGDGSVWAWGRNNDGQLGDGTTASRLTPVPIANAGMVWKVPTPVLSVPGGVYTAEQTVTVTSGDPGATLHYTTNGASPVESDPVVTSGGTVAVTVSLTLKVRAWKPGAVASETASETYELKVVPPAFSPSTGQYASPQNVTMSSATAGATFTYTTDGTEPTPASTPYSGPIPMADTRTLKAWAFRTGWTPSDSAAASYWISAGTVATPTIAPAGGSHAFAPLVTLASASVGATIRYTLDGSDPDGTSARYDFPFLVERTATVKARAFATGMTPSGTAAATFTLHPAGETAPATISPAGGRFASRQTITITGPPAATLRYTTNGVDPTETDAEVPAGGQLVVDRAQIVKVRAWLTGSSPSQVRRADFWITGALAAGQQHSLALTHEGTVLAWGRGSEGQLGHGSIVGSESVPVQALTGATGIAGGQYHSLAVREDGTVWAWGHNGSGRLGDGTLTNRSAPVQVVGLTDVIAVAGGWDHSLALKRDGTVWAWGNNDDGQLGDGTTADRLTPVQVPGLSGVARIAAGNGFSVALQRDGSGAGFVWAWGRNAGGQLGDGSTLARTVPVRTIGAALADVVMTGTEFAAAVLADGTVRAWGVNDLTQLGTLAVGSSTQAIPVAPLTRIVSGAAGSSHGVALDPDGRVWGWGDNTNGQLGTPTVFSGPRTSVPHQIVGIAGAIAAAAGWQQSLLLTADGSVWASGTTEATGLGAGWHPAMEQIPGLSLAPNGWLLSDGDGDGLPAWREYLAGLDPLSPDTDGDGLRDAVDVLANPHGANPDDDGDGVPSFIELLNGTDPFLSDTDGDGVPDGLDAFPLDPTRSQAPAPNPSDTTPPTIILMYPASARPVGGGGN